LEVSVLPRARERHVSRYNVHVDLRVGLINEMISERRSTYRGAGLAALVWMSPIGMQRALG
jgi:hypothetical protein